MKPIYFILFIFCILGKSYVSIGQTSSCTVPDSIYQINRGSSAQAVRDYLIDNYLPEKDDFYLPDSLLQRTTEAINAIWRNDSIQGHDTIYDSLYYHYSAHDLKIGAVHVPHIIYFDTNSIYFKNFSTSQVSGDAYFDSLIARYVNELDGLPTSDGLYWGLNLAVFFNLGPFVDSLRTVSWIDSADILTRDNPHLIVGDRGGAHYTLHFKGDTTYIQYQYLYGDCILDCANGWTWNYRVLPNCVVEFLGRKVRDIPNPEVHVFEAITFCEDSINLKEPYIPYDLYHSSLSGYWDSSVNNDSGIVYQSGEYKYFWIDSNDFLVKSWIYVVNKIGKPNLSLSDTILCERDSLVVQGITDSIFWFANLDENEFLFKDSVLKLDGNYTYNIPGCQNIEPFYLDIVQQPTLKDSLFKCTGDSVGLVLPMDLDSFKWDLGLVDSVSISDAGVFPIKMFKAGCAYSDTFVVQNYPIETYEIGKDTIVSAGVLLDYQIDSQFNNILWQDGDTLYNKSYWSNILGFGIHVMNVIAMDSNYCFYSDSFSVQVKDYASAKNWNYSNNLAYPNPFSDFIKLPKAESNDLFDLYNSEGVKVLNGTVGTDKCINSLENLPPGVYYLILKSESYTTTFRMIGL